MQMKTDLFYQRTVSTLSIPRKTITFFCSNGFTYRHHVLSKKESHFSIRMQTGVVTFFYIKLDEHDIDMINQYKNCVFFKKERYIISSHFPNVQLS